eukprot:jgi/Bigna1/77555/fgenesh1_pg.48_\
MAEPSVSTVQPFTLLVIFATIQFITYLDRGIISTYLQDIQNDYRLSGVEAGTLAGAYMVGYMLASPIFAHMASRTRPLLLISIGLLVWSLAVIGTGASLEYGTILIARTFTGVGEASFACLAPPLIDLKAPKDKKSLWMAVFYIFIPVGYAFGYLLAGQWENIHAVHGSVLWRTPFIFTDASEGKHHHHHLHHHLIDENDNEDQKMLLDQGHDSFLQDPVSSLSPSPSALIDHSLSLNHDDSTQQGGKRRGGGVRQMETSQGFSSGSGCIHDNTFLEELKTVLDNRIYILIILGYAAQTFVVGGFAYWGIEYVQGALQLSESTATLSFGSLTVLTGVFGTATGGILLDYLRRKAMKPGTPRKLETKIAAEKATMLLAICSVLSLPCVVIGIGINHPAGFFPMVGLGEFLIFMCLTPINSTVVWITPYEVSPLALAISVLSNHLLGDAISPIIIGEILDYTNRNWRTTFVLMAFWLIWPILLWIPAWSYARSQLRQAEAVGRSKIGLAAMCFFRRKVVA